MFFSKPLEELHPYYRVVFPLVSGSECSWHKKQQPHFLLLEKNKKKECHICCDIYQWVTAGCLCLWNIYNIFCSMHHPQPNLLSSKHILTHCFSQIPHPAYIVLSFAMRVVFWDCFGIIAIGRAGTSSPTCFNNLKDIHVSGFFNDFFADAMSLSNYKYAWSAKHLHIVFNVYVTLTQMFKETFFRHH